MKKDTWIRLSSIAFFGMVLIAIIWIMPPSSMQAQAPSETQVLPSLEFSLAYNPDEAVPGQTIDLTFEATNRNAAAVEDYVLLFYLTNGLELAGSQAVDRDIYDPVLYKTIDVGANDVKEFSLSVTVLETAVALEGFLLTHEVEGEDEILLRTEIPITGWQKTIASFFVF